MGKLHKNGDFTQFSRVFIENSLTNHADKFINRLVGVLKLVFWGFRAYLRDKKMDKKSTTKITNLRGGVNP